jgi:hypothetical protein
MPERTSNYVPWILERDKGRNDQKIDRAAKAARSLQILIEARCWIRRPRLIAQMYPSVRRSSCLNYLLRDLLFLAFFLAALFLVPAELVFTRATCL